MNKLRDSQWALARPHVLQGRQSGGGGGLEPAEPYAGSSKPLVLICKSTAHVQAHTSGSTVVLPI